MEYDVVVVRTRRSGSERRWLAGLAAVGAMVAATLATGIAPAYADDPVAGGQSASPADTLFPNQGNSGYDVSHYDINFSVDVTTSAVSNAVGSTNIPAATATIQASTTGAPLASYSFDFQGSTGNLAASSFNIDAVTVDGVPATFSRVENTTPTNTVTDNHKLIITPATPVSGAFTTVVTYHGVPVRHTDADNSAEGWNNTTDGATFLNQPVGAMTLFPNNNTPRDKATYTFTVDAPTMLSTSNFANAGGKPYQAGVVSNGELVSRTLSGDSSRTTWVWDQAKPMASELSMVSIGRYDIYQSTIHLALSNRDIPEWTFIDPAISVANQTSTLRSRAQLKALLDFYESKYGPYPGNSIGLVTDVVPSAINYALETQDRPFFPNSASGSTFYHEVMHQWWGDSVAPTDWNDITLNEGPATYAESQFPYEGAGSSATTTESGIFALYNQTPSGSDTRYTVAPAAMTQASQLFGAHVYSKGAMALEALRTSIGAASFETLMRSYQTTYGGGQIAGRRTAAFQAMAESISGRNLTSFFNTWWYTTGKPAWPAKFNLNLAGPTSQVNAGDPVSYTLSLRNTGKVATTNGSVVLTLDASDLLDDATIGALPADVTQAGNTLTWAVPATALAATSSVAIPFTVDAVPAGNSTLTGTAAATTLGGTCLDCTASTAIGIAPISPAPVPTITGGTPTVAAPLTADTTGWAGGTSFTYQWLVDGTPVAGATNPTYTPDGNALGLTVTVKVTGTLAGFNATSATSAPTAAVVKATPASSTPTISGTAKIGVPLTVDPGAWEPDTVFTYQWRANGANISGATGPIYTPAVAGQVGQTIDVIVTGTKFGYTTTAKTSATTAAVAAGDPLSLTPTPVLTGTPKVGVSYTASPGAWDDGVALTYQWAANGVNVSPGGTSVAITPTAAQLGQTLTITVTGTKPGITPVSKTSAVSAPVDPGTQTLQPTPTITGTPRALVSSTGVAGTWDTGTALAYQWYADGVAIPSATALTYTPTLGQVGQLLTFEVTSTRAGYTTVVKTSAGQTVLPATQVLQPTPSVTGTAKVGRTLTGDPGTWDVGTAQSYQWLADGTPIGGATTLTYDLTTAELGKAITFAVTSTRAGYDPVTKTSAPTGAVGDGDLTDTPVPTITGTPKVDVTLTAVPGSWDSGVSLDYQWTVDGANVPGATATTYAPVPADSGKAVTVKVTGSKPGYTTVTKESAPTAAVADGDQVATPTPTITGTPKVGDVLTAVPGDWDSGVVLAYHWTVDGADVPSAVSSTYTPVAGDAGKVVTVKITGTRTGYVTVTKESAQTAPVANGDQGSTPKPTISGTPQVDVQLTADPGSWDVGTTFSYQWTVGGSNVAGASDPTYTPAPADAGSVVTVKVTGSRPGFNSVTEESDPTAPVAPGELTTTSTPTITGASAQVGVLFTADPGSWDAGVTFAYQWTADGTPITGATHATYRAVAGDLGKVLRVEVTGSKTGYTSVTQTSDPTSAIQLGDQTNTPKPTISGTARVAVPLTAVPGAWDAGVVLSYQWTVGGTNVVGATTSTYTPVPADLGQPITVKVTGTKNGYNPVTRQSDPTAGVLIGNLVLTPTPTLSDPAKVGVTVDAVPGTWDSGVALTYQWAIGGNDIVGATTASYTPVALDVGKVLTVKVTGAKNGFATTTVESSTTAPAVVKGDLVVTSAPKITGTPRFGQTLVANPGAWDAGVSFSYQWLADGMPVSGATGSTFTLRVSDVGKSIVLFVTGTRPGYNAVTRISAGTPAVAAASLAANQCTVKITGKAVVGKKLTAVVANCPAGATLHYAWYAGSNPIPGADAATYKLKKAQAGDKIKVMVSITLPGYVATIRTSKATGKVKD